MMGDQIFVHSQQVGTRDDTIQYLMPRRVGLEFGLYPWHAHLKDAVAGAKAMLTALGEWHHTEQDVRQVGSEVMPFVSMSLEHPWTGQHRNHGDGAAGSQQGCQVQGVGWSLGAAQPAGANDVAHPRPRRGCQLQPNKFSSLSVAGQMENNVYDFLTEGHLPQGIAQFFSLQDMP